MEKEGIPTLEQLLKNSRRDSMLADATDEGVFLDAMGYGVFHEEDADWPAISTLFTDAQLASLYPGICHALVRGVIEPNTPKLMACYDALAKWQRGELRDSTTLAEALADVRELVIGAVLDNRALWWVEQLHVLQIIEVGVAMRTGRDFLAVLDAYDDVGYKFDEAPQSTRRRASPTRR